MEGLIGQIGVRVSPIEGEDLRSETRVSSAHFSSRRDNLKPVMATGNCRFALAKE